MSGRRWLGVLGVWGLLGLQGASAEIIIQWEWQPTVVIDSFLVSYQASTDPGEVLQQFRVPWTSAPTCQSLGAPAPPTMVCARPPSCLPPGVYTFSVQAERGTEVSDFSNWFTCRILAGCRVDCQGFDLTNEALRQLDQPAPTPPAAPVSRAPVSLPDRTSLQALETELARLHQLVAQPPAAPPVATAPT